MILKNKRHSISHNFFCFQILRMNDIVANKSAVKEYYDKNVCYYQKIISKNQRSMRKTTNAGCQNFDKMAIEMFQNLKMRKYLQLFEVEK